MKALEIIILVLAVALVIFTIIFNVIRRKKRRAPCNNCTQNCCGCAFSKSCNSDSNLKNK